MQPSAVPFSHAGLAAESDDVDVEKVIAGGQSATITLGPLDAGRYEFHGEYHEDTAKGALVAK